MAWLLKAMLVTGIPICLMALLMGFRKIEAKNLIVGSLLVLSCLFILYIYALLARCGVSEPGNDNPKQSVYNLLVDGFRSGQLSLKEEVPSGLAHLENPYDAKANADYRDLLTHRLHDTSFYQGKLYLYFGVTPALLLFWPWAALTGHYLFHWEATAIFCAIGFLINLVLLCDIKLRYFQDTPRWVLIPLVLALGLASGIPTLVARPDIWEVAVSCAYMLRSLILAAIWFTIHRRTQRAWWLAAASLACGLAVGARPTAVFYAATLIVPVLFYLKESRVREEKRQAWRLLVPAIIPIAVCGIGLATYNYRRFGRPFEFGMKYALAGKDIRPEEMFKTSYFWYNSKTYLLSAARFTTHSPFVEKPLAMTPLPLGHWGSEDISGVLINLPIVWLMLALPLAWTRRMGEEKAPLQLLGATAVWVSASTFLLLCFFMGASGRYEVEFLPPCILLSAIAILSLERAGWNRLALRMAWNAILCLSIAFGVLYGIYIVANYNRLVGTILLEKKQPALAADKLYEAVAFAPDDAESYNKLGIALALSGHPGEANVAFTHAIAIDPANNKYRINRNQLCHLQPAGLQAAPSLSNPHSNRSP
jgi:hypothetical protein